jgi:predicted PurR-regulated permease PerM
MTSFTAVIIIGLIALIVLLIIREIDAEKSINECTKELKRLSEAISERDNAYSNLFEKIFESYAEIENNNHEFLKVAAETINENMIYDAGMIGSIFDTTNKIADYLDIEDGFEEDVELEGENDNDNINKD